MQTRLFTISQIRAHFIGEPYAELPEFIGHLVRNKILIKVDNNHYTYDLSKLNETVIVEITMTIKRKLYLTKK